MVPRAVEWLPSVATRCALTAGALAVHRPVQRLHGRVPWIVTVTTVVHTTELNTDHITGGCTALAVGLGCGSNARRRAYRAPVDVIQPPGPNSYTPLAHISGRWAHCGCCRSRSAQLQATSAYVTERESGYGAVGAGFIVQHLHGQ